MFGLIPKKDEEKKGEKIEEKKPSEYELLHMKIMEEFKRVHEKIDKLYSVRSPEILEKVHKEEKKEKVE